MHRHRRHQRPSFVCPAVRYAQTGISSRRIEHLHAKRNLRWQPISYRLARNKASQSMKRERVQSDHREYRIKLLFLPSGGCSLEHAAEAEIAGSLEVQSCHPTVPASTSPHFDVDRQSCSAHFVLACCVPSAVDLISRSRFEVQKYQGP